MRLVVVAVGRLKRSSFSELAEDYLGRIRRYTRCDVHEVRDATGLERALPVEAWTVALEVDGEQPTSNELARWLEQWSSRGKGVVAFVIGGAEGIPSAVSRQAAMRLSLSRLTLPHRLVRVVLLEQLYRALTIQRGEPYARED